MNSKLAIIVTCLSISPKLLFSEISQTEQPNPMPIQIISNNQQNQKKTRNQRNQKKNSNPHNQTNPTQRIEVKHIESKGVGYDQGYSTLEGFFTIPYMLDGSWVPFLDVRAHIFNNGKPAVNGGLGIRYLTNSRAWGLNTYYDYRKTHRFHYNQVGFGFESLGEIWDFRANAYVPVGKKGSSLYQTHFHEFKNHSIILSSKKEISMIGANAEVAAHALRTENYNLYTAAGPYYFEQEGKVAWGGEGRVAFSLYDYVRFQISGSYDTVFHGIVQGEVALTFSFGGKRTIKSCQKKNRDTTCSDQRMVKKRALQRVDRNEIVVVTKKHEKTKAVDPDTGKPYTVWFVDNTSHSQGTYESPFSTLSAAESASGPSDVIYVFKGDGTDTGMNSGLTLKHGQQLLGAGIDQKIATTLGTITIPAQESGLPVISNANDPTILGVQLVNGNNVVSGFILNDALGSFNGTLYSAPLTIQNGSNYLIQNNQFSTFDNGSGINIYGPGNNTAIVNNIFLATTTFNQTTGVFFYDILAPVTGSFYIADNLFKGSKDSSGLNTGIASFANGVPLQPSSNIAINIVSNTFVSQTNTGGVASAILWAASNGSASIVGNYINATQIVNLLAGIIYRNKVIPRAG